MKVATKQDNEDVVLNFLRKRRFLSFLRRFTLPGFGGVPISEVVKFFWQHLKSEAIVLRSSATAYSFFLALFPGLIFLFTLIPYIPIQGLHKEVLQMMHDYMPSDVYSTVESTISDILLTKRGNLLSLVFILSIYFSANGVNTLLVACNRTLNRVWWKKFLIALVLTFILVLMILLAMSIQVGGEIIISYFKDSFFFGGSWIIKFIWFFKLLTTLLLSISAISIIFFYASPKGERFKFFSPGAFIATILIVLVSYGFGYYVDNFANYNRLYGSLGAIIILLVWLYLSAISLITGYEFDHSIFKARASIRKVGESRIIGFRKSNTPIK